MSAPTRFDHRSRLERLRASLGAAGCDAVLVTAPTDVRWLVGFTGSAGDLLVGPTSVVLLTDGRYAAQAEDQLRAASVDATVVADHAEHRDALAGALGGAARIGLQADHVSWARQRSLAAGPLAPPHELVAVEGLLVGLRAIKEPAEVACIEAAAAIADAALAEVRPLVAAGTPEIAVARALDAAMRDGGASGPSFETIVAGGPNGARPHHRPGDRRLAEGDLVVIDFGATVEGYRSDMTRTLRVGALDEVQERMLEVVGEAQAAGVAAVRPGVAASEVDAACRAVIAEAGWADAFVHGTGHGVGLDIHEEPRVSSSSAATLAPGHVVTVEPGVYLPEHGGVRIEDTLVVTDDGHRVLTRAPKHV